MPEAKEWISFLLIV